MLRRPTESDYERTLTVPRTSPFHLRKGLREMGPLTDAVAESIGLHGDLDGLRCLLANLAHCYVLAPDDLGTHRLLLSRSGRTYTRPTSEAYRGRVATVGFRGLIEAADKMVAAGFAEERRGSYADGLCTEAWPTACLVQLVGKLGADIRLRRRTGYVKLTRPGTGISLDYRPNHASRRMTAELGAASALSAQFSLSYLTGDPAKMRLAQLARLADEVRAENVVHLRRPGAGAGAAPIGFERVQVAPSELVYTRVFHPGEASWTRHGRFYAPVQGLSGEERRTLLVGHPAYLEPSEVVELDVMGMHLTLVYHWDGLDAPADPYLLPGLLPEYRAVYKAAALILLNSSGRAQAVRALDAKLRDEQISVPAGKTPSDILSDMEAAHAPIARHFYANTGSWVMHLDSQIAAGVIRRVVEHSRLAPEYPIPPIAIHDSFVVPAFAEEVAYYFIVDAYQEVMGQGRIPTVKCIRADGSAPVVNHQTYASAEADVGQLRGVHHV